MSDAGLAYLHQYLGPLQPWLQQADITDLYVNRPSELWIETMAGGISRADCPELDAKTLDRLARQIAAFSSQGVSREHPLLSATLPDGARVQLVLPPATRGDVALAIRKHVVMDRCLADYDADHSFAGLSTATSRAAKLRVLRALQSAQGPSAMLAEAVRQRCNILVSGGTSTGKSTFLNALLKEVAGDERLIFIEDTPELKLEQANAIGLLAPRSQLGEASVTPDDLLNAALRMRPDRIILGEIRGREAFTFLRAINTGHPGSMSTIHADSPERAIDQLALLVLQSGTQLKRQDVADYVRSTIDVFVQLERISSGRRISAIEIASQ